MGETITVEVRNREGETVGGLGVYWPTMTIAPGYEVLPLHQTRTEVLIWQVETSPSYEVEVNPGESYYLVVKCRLRGGPLIKAEPIRVVIQSAG